MSGNLAYAAAAWVSASTMSSTTSSTRIAIVALAHHADHRLGAGRADDQAAVAVEPLRAVDDRGLHLGVLERLALR